EGATLEDIARRPTMYSEYDRLRKTINSRDPQEKTLFTIRQMAIVLAEQEAVGYRAALDYARAEGYRPSQELLEKRRRSAELGVRGTELNRLLELIDIVDRAPAEDRELILKSEIFNTDIYFLHRELYQYLVQTMPLSRDERGRVPIEELKF